MVALIITFSMYLPLWQRLVRRKTSGDHSKWTWGGVFILQLLGLAMAWLDGAEVFYIIYYPAQIVVVGTTIILVWRYYD